MNSFRNTSTILKNNRKFAGKLLVPISVYISRNYNLFDSTKWKLFGRYQKNMSIFLDAQYEGTKSKGGGKGGREESGVEEVHGRGGGGRAGGRGRGGRGQGGGRKERGGKGRGGRGRGGSGRGGSGRGGRGRGGRGRGGKGRGGKGIEVGEREKAREERDGREVEYKEETYEENEEEREKPNPVSFVEGQSAAGVKRKARGGGERRTAKRPKNQGKLDTRQTSNLNAKRVEYIRVR